MIMLPVILGIAALAIDAGVIYNTRTDLQHTADAGAMAAAAALSTSVFVDDPLEVARQEAIRLVERNNVLGRPVTLDPQVDVVFGRGNYDPVTNTYNFVPTTVLADAVRVIVRCTEGSPNGATDLYFAGLFGLSSTNISASATAAISPRDIAVTADVSGSTRFDSRLRDYQTKKVNTYDVWDGLPGGAYEVDSTWATDEIPADVSQAAGPGWGYFKELCFGHKPDEDGYTPGADPGLIELQKYATWNDTDLSDSLSSLGYNADEIDAIMNPYNEDYYKNRVAVALGLVYWHSGKSGGRWEQEGVPEYDAGNGNDTIGSSEIVCAEQVFQKSMSTSKSIWCDYTNYMRYSGPFQYRFGLKTFTDYLVEQRASPSQTPEFASAPLQPLQAIKDAINYLSTLLTELETIDRMSLHSYSTDGEHQVDLTGSHVDVSNRLNEIQPYGSTNMGAGLERAIEELTGPRGRPMMRKVIILLTDGYANVDRWGNSTSSGGKAYAIEEAERAASLGLQIITISVGVNSDQALMEQIAGIGKGDHYHVEGTATQYTADLVSIFTQIGGRRFVDLIE